MDLCVMPVEVATVDFVPPDFSEAVDLADVDLAPVCLLVWAGARTTRVAQPAVTTAAETDMAKIRKKPV